MSLPTSNNTLSSRNTICQLLILSSAALFISGCATKPWRGSLTDAQREAVLIALDDMRDSEKKRSTCFDADVNIFFTSHLKNRALSGYIQIMQPSWLKFITSNPFGQPLFAFTSDGNDFYYIDTTSRVFMDGNVELFGNKHDSPPFVYKQPWGNWLTGRLPDSDVITGIREDREARGIWVSFAKILPENDQSKGKGTEHILLDVTQRRMLSRVYTNESESVEAEIAYSQWREDSPWQPENISISRLGYGGRLVIDFSALQDMHHCSEKDFRLKKPAGYYYSSMQEKNY